MLQKNSTVTKTKHEVLLDKFKKPYIFFLYMTKIYSSI